MKKYKSIGTICVKDSLNIVYALCKIEYILFEDLKFKYIFTPNYSVIELLDDKLFQGIPGLNLELRKDEYIRDNINPIFISERVPSEKREDYYELLKELNMDFMDPIKFLISTKKQYVGDNLFVVSYEDKKTIRIENDTNSLSFVRQLIENICLGNNIILNNEEINDSNRNIFYNYFIEIYKKMYDSYKKNQQKGIEKAKIEGKYAGRKPINVDLLKFNYLENKLKNKEITRQELLNELGISKDKYYRLKKNSQN